MQGVDPLGYMQQVSRALDRMDDRSQLERVLDEVEYLYEVLDPELQDLADGLIERLRRRLAALP